MAIPNTAQPLRSGVVGTLASDSPARINGEMLSYTFNATAENHATPSRATTRLPSGAVTVGGDLANQPFTGLILGNQRVLSCDGESWYQDSAQIECILMGEVFANIENVESTNPSSAAKIGGKVYFGEDTGKLYAGSGDGFNGEDVHEIPNAVIVAVDDGAKPTRLVRIVLNSPLPA